MPHNPVQIVLNSRNFLTIPDKPPGGSTKDFFEGKDPEFVVHKDRLQRQLATVNSAFQKSGIKAGFVKVVLRKGAWAKTHRPGQVLFPEGKRPCVGAGKIGELFYMVTTADVREISSEVEKAEEHPKKKLDRETGEAKDTVSSRRSEVGAVESIKLPTASDKRSFSAEEGVRWLADPRTGRMYFVEVFTQKAEAPLLTSSHHDLTQRAYTSAIRDALIGEANKAGLEIEVLPITLRSGDRDRIARILGVRLKRDSADPTQHQRLLSALEEQVYVRQIVLPPIITRSATTSVPVRGDSEFTLPIHREGVRYPKVGVVDGGISSFFSPWILGSHSPVAPEHLDTSHADFIAGLLVSGRSLNGRQICFESDGCELFDIAILPDEDAPFADYYPNGPTDVMQEVANAVELAKREHGVRIFNMSLNLESPVADESYGAVAEILDEIADEHDVLFVISAGNLKSSDWRQSWPSDASAALRILASRTAPETLLQPAESARCLSVGAVNPPGIAPHIAGAPTCYSRRGPGMRVGMKPDLAHFGGAPPNGHRRTGLTSCDSSGARIDDLGTSYASPLVAKSAASLESQVIGALPPNTINALLVHNAALPTILNHATLHEVARQFVGFGVPAESPTMLETPDHQITLVFSDIIRRSHELQFTFTWPSSLVREGTGACIGRVKMTLAYRPPLDARFGSEFVRVNLDAHLRQEDKESWTGRLRQMLIPKSGGSTEAELIRHGLKWWPLKTYEGIFPRGKGSSSNWCLVVQPILRAGEKFPTAGVPFTVVLSISGITQKEPVFNEMRTHLLARNVQIHDIRTAVQIRTRAN